MANLRLTFACGPFIASPGLARATTVRHHRALAWMRASACALGNPAARVENAVGR
jgi:hypothetical protein